MWHAHHIMQHTTVQGRAHGAKQLLQSLSLTPPDLSISNAAHNAVIDTTKMVRLTLHPIDMQL